MIDLSNTADMQYQPSLYDVHVMLDEWIVGEHKSRMAIFTNWILGCQNVNVAGQRAGGKTWCVQNVGNFLPEKNGLYNLSMGSEKSAFYQAEMLRSHSHIMIPELNKLNKTQVEILKMWGEGKEATYDVTVGEGRTRYVEKKRLHPKPFIFCLADEEEIKIDEQLRSRLTVVRVDVSEEQNKAVMNQKADLAIMPKNPKRVDREKFKKMKEHIGTLPPFSEKLYRHPAADIFVSCIPSIYTDCRRDFPKYLNNTYGITRFHWKNRLVHNIGNTPNNKKKVYLVTPQDMYYNHVIYGQTLVESSLRCSNMERQLIAILQRSGKQGSMNRTQLQKEIRKAGMNISAHMIRKYMENLSDQGYVDVMSLGSGPQSYIVGGLFKDFKFDIDWNLVLSRCKDNIQRYYGDIADKYIASYIDNPTVVHPFTGEQINLRNVKGEGVTTHQDSGMLEEEPVIEEEQVFDRYTK